MLTIKALEKASYNALPKILKVILNSKKEVTNWFILTVLFFIVSSIIFIQFGIKNVNDSHRYLNYATNLENGFYLEKHNSWYIGYPIFIYLIRFLTGSYSELNLILWQYIYSFLGLIFLYKSLKTLDPNSYSPLIGCILYFISIEVCIWNSYILCESFYYNNTVIAIYYLNLAFKKTSFRNIVLATLFTLLTFISKPTGFVLALSLGITAFIIFWINSKTPKITKVTFLIFGIALIGLLLNSMLKTFLIIENYQLGEIVYAISTIPQKTQYMSLIVEVPELNTLPDDYPPLLRIFHFILYNFWYWCTLFFKKSYYFLLHIRPYWSLKHNIYNLIVLIPIYTFTIRQILYSPFVLRVFSIIYIGFHILIVGFTTLDWDGRFFLPLIPILIILSSQGINKQIENFYKK